MERQNEDIRLKECERFLLSAMDALPGQIAIVDETGTIIAVNRKWRAFASSDDVRQGVLAEVGDCLAACRDAGGEDAWPPKGLVHGVLDVIHGRAEHFEMEYPRHAASCEHWFAGSVVPIPGDALPRRVVFSQMDVTDRKAAEKKAAQLEEAFRSIQKLEVLGTLAGGIAHDFNNILSAIIGYSDLILEQAELDSETRADLEEIARAGGRARNLVKQLLKFSRRTEGAAGPVQAHLIVKESLKMLRAALPSSIDIKAEILTIGEVDADPAHIHQVMMNLCTNAYQAMREDGGVLEVRLSEVEIVPGGTPPDPALAPGAYMVLVVSDTGTGMDASTRQRIFDPHFTTRTGGEGTGLGLSTVKAIVSALGGAVTVESRPGKGAVFSVFFPMHQPPEAPDRPEQGASPAGCTARILFVDDEPVLLRLARKMLEKNGCRVDTSSSSTEALHRFQEHPDDYDMVITDMTMPQLTGDRLAREILKIRPEIPVIICTGFSERIDKAQAAAIGARALLIKPFDRHELLHIIQHHIAPRQNRKTDLRQEQY